MFRCRNFSNIVMGLMCSLCKTNINCDFDEFSVGFHENTKVIAGLYALYFPVFDDLSTIIMVYPLLECCSRIC